MAARELAVAGRHERCHDRLSEHTRALPPLQIGDHVAIQNQHGNNPLKWQKRGIVVSVLEFDKYGVKVLGSGRLTYRNRQHLRPYTPDVLEYKQRQYSKLDQTHAAPTVDVQPDQQAQTQDVMCRSVKAVEN